MNIWAIYTFWLKRCLLLGREAMANLDNILKSRDITLLTKVHIVMYGYESWAIKKAECGRIDAFELWCWRRLLRVSRTARRSNQSILKEINPEHTPEGLKLKLQYFGHLIWRANSLEKTLTLGKIEGRRRRGLQRMRWFNDIIDLIDLSLSKLQEIVVDRESWGAAVHGLQRVRQDWAAEQQQHIFLSVNKMWWIFVCKLLFEYLFLLISLLGVYWEVNLMGYMANFWGTTRPFSTAAVPFYISTDNVQGSQFLYMLIETYFLFIYLFVLIYSHPSGHEVVSPCVWLAFP